MKSTTKFETLISADPENKKLIVKREFNAPLDLVWKVWTTSEMLDKWWAPKPYQTVTVKMDFSEGGRWFYYMISPQGDKHWCKADYSRISQEEFYEYQDAFCDEHENEIPEMPSTKWHVDFSTNQSSTTVTTTLLFESVEALNRHIEMGFKEGVTMAHGNLDELLENLLTGKAN